MDAILIAGPTASGKSSLALRLASKYAGVVVNADAMQVYAPLHILTARPSPQDMALVEHRLYGHVPGATAYSTGSWYRDIAETLDELRRRGRLPVVVGGTGLYFRALTGGLSTMPAIPDDVRDFWRERLREKGAGSLHEELSRVDAETARGLMPADGQRIVRALEVFHATGRSIRDHQKNAGHPLIDAARAARIILSPPRDVVRRRIAERASTMLEDGACAEVGALMNEGLDERLPVMKAIGVREIAAYLAGKCSREEAKERLITLTRQYAKRQMTWFRNQLGEGWETIGQGENYTPS